MKVAKSTDHHDRVLPMSNLTNYQKRRICSYKLEHPDLSQKKIAKWAQQEFYLAHPPSQSSISRALKLRPLLERSTSSESSRKPKVMTYKDLDLSLANWVKRSQSYGYHMDEEKIMDKAHDFADAMELFPPNVPSFDYTWVGSFTQRHAITLTSTPEFSRDHSTSSDSHSSPRSF
ncbi:hypothetical protein CONCODRAFT_80152 [Conidiobolus coronatus NRRL 28638]|uniref:HTH CENPB-type domain-containing protein n=1 Tax=Conidiobolus coronatus (strain ATCC 28846 / CBS 209.66 / NRRL 28638) TaxID=796925 RepID=A0A137NXK0_CONC2|nr:hypothetical protein CONCODRAFT_80152 [Conidiobolus coronatus NRRL 28638]|eukprot:KXN67408.1 hypothetical protein CONCODRAFT_80152 [Conidiobolus coronatus NRRL 28638]